MKKASLIGVGFEPTPPKRPVPETGALDRSAIQPTQPSCFADSLHAPSIQATSIFPCTAPIAQLVEHGSNKPRVGGSSPSWSIFYFAIWQHAAVMPLRAKKHFVSTACWFINNSSSLEVEHRSYEPGVAGSIPAWSTCFCFCFLQCTLKLFSVARRARGKANERRSSTLPGPVV